jgi:ribosomal protein S1
MEQELTHDVDTLQRKTHFTGTVIKTTLAGAVVDIGLGVPGVVHISQLKAEPVNRVEDVVHVGQQVEVWVRRVFPKKNRIELTMVKPLEYEWRDLEKDMQLKGKVVRLEKFGAFVDIGAERPGLVHISEMTHGYIKSPGEVVHEGDEIEVKVLNVNRQKRQIKLSMKALEEKPERPARPVKEAPPPAPVKSQPQTPPVEDEPKEVPVPTAMEMALREAMQRNKTESQADVKEKRKQSTSQDELNTILNRTLEQKVKTGK